MQNVMNGAIYESLHVSYDHGCSIDVTNLADIFTGYRTRCPRKNLKISAQIDEPFGRYRGYKYGGIGLFWGTF